MGCDCFDLRPHLAYYLRGADRIAREKVRLALARAEDGQRVVTSERIPTQVVFRDAQTGKVLARCAPGREEEAWDNDWLSPDSVDYDYLADDEIEHPADDPRPEGDLPGEVDSALQDFADRYPDLAREWLREHGFEPWRDMTV